jgi:septation ring formation regulator EzrA
MPKTSNLPTTKFDLENLESKFGKVEVRLDKVEVRLDKVEVRLNKVESKIDIVDKKLDKLQETLDGFVGVVDDLRTDNVVAAEQFRDHEKRISKLESLVQPA